jgi:hypothetical protein
MISKVLLRFLAFVGAVSILGFCGYVVIPKLRPMLAPPLTHSFPSPDGKYKAALFIDAGGGIGTGYCQAQVLIVPASYDERTAALERNRDRSDVGKYEVFYGPCDEFSNHVGSPKLDWVSDNNLKIALSINSTALFPHDFRLKKIDSSQQIQVTFVVQ